MESNKLQLFRKLTSLENLPFLLLTLLLVLVPVAFSYSQFLSFVYLKALFISVGVLLTFIISILAVIKRGTISFPKNLLAASVAVLALVFLVSSLVSTSRVGSLLGYGFEVGTFSFFLVVALLAYLVSVSFSSTKKLYAANAAFLLTAGFLALFHTLRFLFGADFISLGLFDAVTANTVGKLNELGIFFGIGALLSLFALEILKLKKVQKVVVYSVLVLSLFAMIVINFSVIWIVVGAIATIFFVYTAAHSTVIAERISGTTEMGAEVEMPRRRIAIKSLIVAIIALAFVLPVGRDAASSLGVRFGVDNVEVRPSWGATLGVFIASTKTDPVFGIGPNRFGIAWQLYRPDINATNFWSTNFDSAIGFIPTSIVETGIVGLLAWCVFLAMLAWLGIKSLFSNYADRMTRFLVTSSLGIISFLWVMNIFYNPGTVVMFLTFFFTGLFIASTAVANITTIKSFEFIKYPKIGFVTTMAGVIVLVCAAGLSYMIFEQGRASVYFQKALAAANQGADANTSAVESNLLDAIRLSKRDLYYRSLSQFNLSKVNALIASASGQEQVTEAQRNEFQAHIANAVEAARLAQVADPMRLENQLMVAQVYATIVPVGVEGSYEAAKLSYEGANSISPRNPGIYLALAQLAASNKDLKAAQDYLSTSLEFKPNYIDAIFFQAQLDASAGNLNAAIKRVEQIVALTPEDPLIYFRLGLLKYDAKDFVGAVAAFEKSIALVPVYANAKYFLGLSYAGANRNADAIKIFEELKAENPTNTELDTILTNLKAGKAPFAAVAPASAKPEKGKKLPVAETN